MPPLLMAPQPPPPNVSYGAVTVAGGQPYIFVAANVPQSSTPRPSMLMLTRVGGEWQPLRNLGRPPTDARLGLSMGSIAIGAQPYVFFLGYGDMWCGFLDKDGMTWLWDNLGSPSLPSHRIKIENSMGAIVVDGNPHIFCTDSDDNLWVCSWGSNAGAWIWKIIGKPPSNSGVSIGNSMGALEVNGRPYVYFKGSDGNMWYCHWDGNTWLWELYSGRPSSSPGIYVNILWHMGTILVEGNPRIYFKASDGNLWEHAGDAGAWKWGNLGKPSHWGVKIGQSMGALEVPNHLPHIYMKGSDGNIWQRFLDRNTQHYMWDNRGQPPGASMENSMGTILLDRTVYIFVGGSGGSRANLYLHYWSYVSNSWQWEFMGRMDE
jgi:hypothetical protein